MKIRNDFVTNSSSSSYVIAYKSDINIPDEIEKQYPVLKFYDKVITSILNVTSYETEEAEIISTKEELDEWFWESCCWYVRSRNLCSNVEEALASEDTDEYDKESYHKMLEYISKGYKIARKIIGNDETSLMEFISTIDDGENFIVIEGDDY